MSHLRNSSGLVAKWLCARFFLLIAGSDSAGKHVFLAAVGAKLPADDGSRGPSLRAEVPSEGLVGVLKPPCNATSVGGEHLLGTEATTVFCCHG